MNLRTIALRNIGRNRTRSALSLLAVAVGVFVVVVTKGTVDGALTEWVRNSVTIDSGHVRIIDEEYRRKERLLSLNYPVDGFRGEGYGPMVEALRDAPHVATVAPRIRFGAMVSQGDELKQVLAMGVDPEAEAEFLPLDRYIGEGRFVKAGERGAVMGSAMMEKLGLEVGEKFTLVFNTSLGALRGYTLTVVGSMTSGLAFLDDGLIYVPLDLAQDMLDMGPAATEIVILSEDRRLVPQTLAGVNELLTERGGAERYAVIPWYEHSEIMKALGMAESIYNFVYVFILFLASFVVVNTMVMIVNERRYEIGVMSALGLLPRQIRNVFLYEGGLMGLLGSAAGVVLGGAVVKLLSIYGIPLPSAYAEMDESFLIPTKLFPEFSLSVLGFAFVAGVLVTAVAVLWPARSAARMEPTQALRL